MQLTHDEEELILLLAKRYEAGDGWISKKEVLQELGLSEDRYESIYRSLHSSRLYEENYIRDALLPNNTCVQWAREIESRRTAAAAATAKPHDLVAQFVGWARSNRVTAALIVGVKVIGPIVGLVGGTLGVIAFCRGC